MIEMTINSIAFILNLINQFIGKIARIKTPEDKKECTWKFLDVQILPLSLENI